MIRLSNLADYAVLVMTAAARGDTRLTAASASALSGVPAATAAKLMGALAKSGLLTSARGATGGFALARSAADISLAEIVEAIDGPIAMTLCGHGETSACELHGSCAVRPHWGPVNIAVRGALAAVMLEQLAGVPAREFV